tara:strand:+ start:289 stop:579 length:291 start_codon:yes stop_codon:yes gene_type:complete
VEQWQCKTKYDFKKSNSQRHCRQIGLACEIIFSDIFCLFAGLSIESSTKIAFSKFIIILFENSTELFWFELYQTILAFVNAIFSDDGLCKQSKYAS